MTPPTRILHVISEAVLQDKPDQAIGKGYREILVDNRIKSRDGYIFNTGRNKEGRMDKDLNIDYQKGDVLRVLFEMWDRIAWAYEL